jgi:hypothetical protein
MESALSASYMGIGDVHVTRSRYSSSGISGTAWTVTFLKLIGDLPMLEVNVTGIDANYSYVKEFLKGHANQFIIEPKKASGAPVKDITAADNFAGKDTFYTELWAAESATTIDGTHTWIKDGFQATYNPVVYAVQEVSVLSTEAFNLTMDMRNRTAGSTYTTNRIQEGASAYDVKLALEELPNIEAVDVNLTSSGGTNTYFITFTHDLGHLPTQCE